METVRNSRSPAPSFSAGQVTSGLPENNQQEIPVVALAQIEPSVDVSILVPLSWYIQSCLGDDPNESTTEVF